MTAPNRNYVPKKAAVRWKICLLIFVSCCLIAYGGQWLLSQREKKQINTYGVCGLNNAQTRKLFPASSQDELVLEFQDYLYYGETLNLYHSPYQKNSQDLFVGKTVILKNLCTGLDFVYMIEKNVDGQIPVEDLDPGFYQVYVMEELKEKKVVSTQKVQDTFYTVTRNGTNHKVELIANQNLFDETQEEEVFLDKNYLFVQISEEKQPEDWVDVMIDPGGLHQDNGYTDHGAHGNDLVTDVETHKMALLLKEQLEKLGLKVAITRDVDEVVNTYGQDGRLARGYQKHARYYLELQLRSATNPSLRGTEVLYSSFSSNRFASSVFKSLIEQAGLVSSGNSKSTTIPGVVPGGTIKGEDGNLYDGLKILRETGGRLLGAGSFSEASRQANSSFASENRYGMQAITIQYGYLSNQQDVQVWNENTQKIAEATAEGFVKYLRIKK